MFVTIVKKSGNMFGVQEKYMEQGELAEMTGIPRYLPDAKRGRALGMRSDQHLRTAPQTNNWL